jgi:putative Mn2+ efflux pump MntP
MHNTTNIVRWLARIFSAAILLFWGFFLIAYFIGNEATSSRPPIMSDYLILTAVGISLPGLAVAWKWELPGAVMVLAGCVILAGVSWRIFASPYVLWPVAAVLFLASWWMHRAVDRGTASARLI